MSQTCTVIERCNLDIESDIKYSAKGMELRFAMTYK